MGVYNVGDVDSIRKLQLLFSVITTHAYMYKYFSPTERAAHAFWHSIAIYFFSHPHKQKISNLSSMGHRVITCICWRLGLSSLMFH